MSDHDLLIELRTEMRAMRGELKDMRDNIGRRVEDLEDNKVSVEEWHSSRGDAEKIHNDHEARLRSLEKARDDWQGKYAVLAGLLGIVVSAAVSWLFSRF